MNEPHPRTRFCTGTRRQEGVVLLIGMLFMLAMTLLGLGVMRNTALDRKIIANDRQHQLALQSAEAALRDAESWIESQSRPVPASADGSTHVWHKNVLNSGAGAASGDSANWQTYGVVYGALTAAPALSSDSAPPRHVTEELGLVRDSLTIGQDPARGDYYYQITGRADGTSDAVTLLESTYMKRYN